MDHSKSKAFFFVVLLVVCPLAGCSSLDGIIVLDPQKYYYEKVVLPNRGNTKTPEIVQAVLDRDASRTEALLSKGVKVDEPDPDHQESSALTVAAMRNFAPVVPALLKVGANPNFKNSHGRTPVFFAVFNGSEEILQLLLKHGAQVDGTYSMVLRGVQGYYTLQDIAQKNKVGGHTPQKSRQISAILAKHGAPGPKGFEALSTNTLNKDNVARLDRVAKFFQQEE